MPTILPFDGKTDLLEFSQPLIESLRAGGLAVFPTETVYGVAALASDEAAVAKLLQAKGRGENHPLALAIHDVEAAWDYAADWSWLMQRLAKRLWPGPLTLVASCESEKSAVGQFPPAVQQAVAPQGTVGLRCPAHPVLQTVLRELREPLVLSSANLSGQPAALDSEQAASALGDAVDFIVTDGKTELQDASTVVLVQDDRLKILREGVLKGRDLQRYASLFVLVVCTGNTCRSPMAEVLLKQKAAERLQCSVEQLSQRGVMIASAGVYASDGSPASIEAVAAMRQRGLDLTMHHSQLLDQALVQSADLILTLTASHRGALLQQWPDAVARTFVMGGEQDVDDPFGGPQTWYEQCAQQIDGYLQEWVSEIPWDRVAKVEA